MKRSRCPRSAPPSTKSTAKAAPDSASISPFRPFSVSAFTLIEMVVVTLIIATLAALVTTASFSVFERTRKVQAKNDVTQLVTAINAFYTEYGKYPVNGAPATDSYFGTGTAPTSTTLVGTNDVLVDVLRNNTTAGGANLATVTALNPRGIVFISPSAAKNTTPAKGGISTTGQYMDPWGSQYAIEIDTTYDNKVTNPYSDTDNSAGAAPLQFGAIVFSLGKNGLKGGGTKLSTSFANELGTAGTYKVSSDVISWQ